MPSLLEDPTLIWVAGAVLLTLASIVYTALRTPASLAAVALVVLLTAAGVLTEWLVRTTREQAQFALGGLLDTIEQNDLRGVLAALAPGASSVRADAEKLMPEFDIDKANKMGAVEVTLDDDRAPTRADVRCRVFISAQHRRTGAKGGDMADVVFTFVRSGDRWLLSDYNASKEWRKGAAELRSKR